MYVQVLINPCNVFARNAQTTSCLLRSNFVAPVDTGLVLTTFLCQLKHQLMVIFTLNKCYECFSALISVN